MGGVVPRLLGEVAEVLREGVMTNAEKKEYLMQYRKSEESIERWEKEKEKWEERAQKMSPTYSDMPKGGKSNRLLDCVEKIIDLERKIDQEIDKLVDLRTEIESCIKNINDEFLKNVLRYIYIDGMKLEEVAIETGYCYRHIERRHRQALDVLECPKVSV